MEPLPWKDNKIAEGILEEWDSVSQVRVCQNCGSLVFEFTADNHAEIDFVSLRSWWKFFRHYAKKTFAFKCEKW